MLNKRGFRIRLFFEGILIGLATGTIVVLFRYILQQATIWLERLYAFLSTHAFWWTILWLLALTVIALTLGKIVQYEAGDYLNIMTNENQANETKHSLLQMAGHLV